MSLQCISEKISVRLLVIATGILHLASLKQALHRLFYRLKKLPGLIEHWDIQRAQPNGDPSAPVKLVQTKILCSSFSPGTSCNHEYAYGC